MPEPKQCPTHLLVRLGLLADQRVSVDKAIVEAVLACIDEGAKWKQVALMLGTSTQAAWERYRIVHLETESVVMRGQQTLFSDLRTVGEMEQQEERQNRKHARKRIRRNDGDHGDEPQR